MPDDLSQQPVSLVVEPRAHGWRVDHYLTRLFPNYSRSLFQKAIEQQAVTVNGLAVKMSRRLRTNDVLSVRLPSLPDETIPPENIPLDVLFEDEHLVVINKAAGMITHPGKGNYGGTLAGALQFHFDRLSTVAGRFRPGIVHRLDRDTSGVLIVAKDNQVHNQLSSQFEQREVQKEYRAIVWGVLDRDSDWIETCMRVNPRQREKMMVCPPGDQAREAVTFYEVLERFYDFTYVRLLPKTGRTHQLRVHMRHLGHPIVADRLYGGRDALTRDYLLQARPSRPVPLPDDDRSAATLVPAELAESAADAEDPLEPETPAGLPASPDGTLIARQALHAFRLHIRHPVSSEARVFEAPLPPDMQNTLAALRNTRTGGIL